MQKLDSESLQFWEKTSLAYHDQMTPECRTYLIGRGIPPEVADSYRLGFVSEPAIGHEMYAGRLAIPILKRMAVVGMKFRCLQDHSCKAAKCPRYLSDGGQWLINTAALDKPSDTIAICEGEPDTWTTDGVLGIPAVGVPGVDAWSSHPWWADLFKGHKRVLILAHNDAKNDKNPGMRLAKKIMEDIPWARLITLPPDMDVNETYLEMGAEELYRRTGIPPEGYHLAA